MTTFHWTDGNGAVPFPGRRVESIETKILGELGHERRVLEIREYLGNETVVSYRQIYPLFLSERECWEDIEARFRAYVYLEVEHDRGLEPATQPERVGVPGPLRPGGALPGGGERPSGLERWRP